MRTAQPKIGMAKRGGANGQPKQSTRPFSPAMKTPISTIAGEHVGLTMQEAQRLYQEAIRSTGFTFSGGTTQSKNQIDLPGDARFLLGFSSANGAWGTVSLTVNQTIVVEDIDTAFTEIGDNKEFYRIGLPLTGNDKIKLDITGFAAYTNESFIFFYI